MKTYDTAYPGSMIERKHGDGDYIDRHDAPSLAAALLTLLKQKDDRIEDLTDELHDVRTRGDV